MLLAAACGQDASPVGAPDPSSTSTSSQAPVPKPVAPPAPAPSVSAPAPEWPVRALPLRLRVPAADVDSELVHLGLNQDGTLAVPTGADYDKAAWYDGSPTPGSLGPSVLEGHVDSAANGPSVFYRLAEVKPGDVIEVDAVDSTTARFEVTRVEAYPKDEFPTAEVYGNTERPELRLITCGGDFDAASGHYRDNTVVYAALLEGSAASTQ